MIKNKKGEEMKTFVFIDASNLFYGGEKSLGWKIDYQKLLNYLKEKYQAEEVLYFGGVEIHNFKFDYLKNETVSTTELEKYFGDFINTKKQTLKESIFLLFKGHLQKVRFYKKLEIFGYKLYLKPVKFYKTEDGPTKRKANCDVDMAFHLMKEKDNFDRVIILSGDGDFLPVLKYLKSQNKEVVVLARGSRTAREIRQFAGSNFRDFVRLESKIKFLDK